jgi:hypothetical protein
MRCETTVLARSKKDGSVHDRAGACLVSVDIGDDRCWLEGTCIFELTGVARSGDRQRIDEAGAVPPPSCALNSYPGRCICA